MMRKIIPALSLLLLLSIKAEADVLLIDDFNRCQKPNLISGDFGIWGKSDWDKSQFTSDSYTSNPNIVYGGKGCSLMLDYDVDSPNNPAYNGLWMRLEKIDLNKYKYLIFYVRGDRNRCFTTRFKIELKNIMKIIKGEDIDRCRPCKRRQGKIRESDIALYEVEGVETQWKQVIVPLEPALKDADFSEAFEFAIIFDEQFVTSKLGRIYVDNIYLTDLENLPMDSSGVIQAKDVSGFNNPPKADFAMPSAVCTGESITLNAAKTKDDSPECLSYLWNLGDGTKAEGVKVTKTYARKGSYKVVLNVDDNQCTRCSTDSISKIIKVNTPPVANAGEDVELCLNAEQEYKVNFDGTRSSDPDGDSLTYKWDFSDGSTGVGSKVSHVYPKGGDYTARLIVDDGSGAACSSSEDTVDIRLNKAPVADAGPNLVCCIETENIFDGSKSSDPDGDPLSYYWDFGDGAKAEGVRVKHVYTKPGTYNVTLMAKDSSGAECGSSVDSFVATVHAKPVPVIKTR